MKEQNHIDQHTHDLVNASIDGELSSKEQAEFDRLFASSPEVRDLYEELKAISSLLDRVPEREPPEYLQSVIEKQIRLPVTNIDHQAKRGLLASWLGANWLRTGFVLAAGLVVTVGVYEMGSEPITDRDSASLVGTVVKNPAKNQDGLLGSILLNTDVLNGVVELRNIDNLIVLDMQLNSDGPSEVVVNFDGKGLVFEDVTPLQDNKAEINESDGTVNLISTGEQHYTMRLRRTSEFEQAMPLKLEFFANNKLVREAELSVSQQ